MESIVRTISLLWDLLPPVRWIVYLGVALAISFYLFARVWRWANRDDEVTKVEHVIILPFGVAVAVLSWLFNWTGGSIIWWDGGPAWPDDWNQTTTLRMRETLKHPMRYPARAVAFSRVVSRWVDKQQPGHVQK